MATVQIGNVHGVAARGLKNINGDNDLGLGLANANMLTLDAKKARLTAINGTYYTAAFLDTLTMNDINYALRLADNPGSI